MPALRYLYILLITIGCLFLYSTARSFDEFLIFIILYPSEYLGVAGIIVAPVIFIVFVFAIISIIRNPAVNKRVDKNKILQLETFLYNNPEISCTSINSNNEAEVKSKITILREQNNFLVKIKA